MIATRQTLAILTAAFLAAGSTPPSRRPAVAAQWSAGATAGTSGSMGAGGTGMYRRRQLAAHDNGNRSQQQLHARPKPASVRHRFDRQHLAQRHRHHRQQQQSIRLDQWHERHDRNGQFERHVDDEQCQIAEFERQPDDEQRHHGHQRRRHGEQRRLLERSAKGKAGAPHMRRLGVRATSPVPASRGRARQASADTSARP